MNRQLETPETYWIRYREYGKLYTYKETLYWETDLFHEISLYIDDDPRFVGRFELISIFLDDDGKFGKKVYGRLEGWVDGFNLTEPRDILDPGWDVDVDENGPFISSSMDWKSTWDNYVDDVWEPEYLGDR